TITLNPNAGGSLRAGSGVTATFSAPAGFSVPASPAIALSPPAPHCALGSPVGNGNVLPVTLADGAGTCTVNNGTVLSLAVAGITNSPTAAAATVNTKSSSDSGATAAGGTLAALAAPTAVTAATSTLAVGAKATW